MDQSSPKELQLKRLRALRIAGSRLSDLVRIRVTDRLLRATLLPCIPSFVTPNMLTGFRIVIAPIIVVFLLRGVDLWAAVLFALAALSDALDGALARTSYRITGWGIVNDPFADKLLIGGAGVVLLSRYLHPAFLIALVGTEVLLVASVYLRYGNRIVPAKNMGKLKMILQCVGLFLVLLYALSERGVFLQSAVITLFAAFVSAVWSIVVYVAVRYRIVDA